MSYARQATTAAIVLSLVLSTATATTYQVSPSGPITSLKSIVNTLQPGDIVEVASGTYNEVMRIECNGTAENPIIIRGVGATRPIFDGTGLLTSGSSGSPRGIFEIRGDYVTLENLEMTNARNYSNNSAGVRFLYTNVASVKNCKIYDNDNGLMGGSNIYTLIEGCDIGFNGDGVGYAHNLYMDGSGTIEMRGSYIHDSVGGQNFKSRAHYNELWYNWISESNDGEIGPVNAASTALANSNFLMVGNTVISKPRYGGNSTKYIVFGVDGGTRNGTLYMHNNTLVAGDGRIDFIGLGGGADAVIANNIFYGSNDIIGYNTVGMPATGTNNIMPLTANVPYTFAGSVICDPDFVDLVGGDFNLLDTSLAIDAGVASPLTYVDGDGVTHTLVIDQSYLQGVGPEARMNVGTIDIGAYEFVVPEPATLTLMSIAVLGAIGRKKRIR